MGSPPRGRGKVPQCGENLRKLGITPAWAGKRPTRTAALATTGDHPRVGGEKSAASVPRYPGSGSPPHGRGKEPCFGDGLRLARITPAWAGKSASGQRCAAPARDHPRVGGEKIGYRYTRKSQMGSPPHGRGKGFLSTSSTLLSGSPPHRRGKVHHHVIKDGQHRITPAWAGKRPAWRRSRWPWRDHPRVGGEKTRSAFASHRAAGSPPRRRGKDKAITGFHSGQRITPARAGKRPEGRNQQFAHQDHPRVGGEKRFGDRSCRFVEGSPPHGRGKAELVIVRGIAAGITPAWAGKNPASQPWSPPLWMMVIRPRP